MIPSLAVVRVGGHRRRAVRLWLPLFLLWPLLLPFGLALAVAGLFLPRRQGVLRAAWQFATGWRGTHIEIDTPEAAFKVQFI